LCLHVFFFSSRRRHTRFSRDWSSDVCSSDLVMDTPKAQIALTLSAGEAGILRLPIIARPPTSAGKDFPIRIAIRYRTSDNAPIKIGRASCRERMSLAVAGGSLKEQT